MASLPPHSPNSPRLSVKESQGFSHLRQLLLAPEQSELEQLKRRLDHYILQPKDVARVLPDAIRLRAKEDLRLVTSMVPITQEAFILSVKQSPQLISDSIAPLLGPMIRKATARAMRGMVQSLNQTLEYSMSWKGLQWRWEAFRTGKSFAEVLLLHTLRFRVEQVFLIHKKTGILLNHVVAEGVSGQGEEVISGMLTAIQDFVRDSFGQKQEDGLESLRIGDLTVWVEQGSCAIIAGVIRGAPPIELREVFQETLELIYAQFSEHLQSFQGDTSIFDETRLPLEDCLQAQFEKKSQGLPVAFWILLCVLFVSLGFWFFQAYSDQQRWTQFLERIGQEPGLVVTSVQEQGAQSIFYGLRDPLAIHPEQILSEFGYSPNLADFRLKPYVALTPDFVHKRAVSQLRPPSAVVIKGEGTELILAGEAPHAWIKKAQLIGSMLPGVTHMEMGQLVDTDVKQFETLKANLEKTAIFFGIGESRPSKGQESVLRSIKETIQAIDQRAIALDLRPSIQIRGVSSPDGTRAVNETLSVKRAKALLDELEKIVVYAIRFHSIGLNQFPADLALFPIETEVLFRPQVVFRVILASAHVSESSE